MSLVIWAEGRLVGQGEAALSAVDHGITVGDGVFETCTVFDGRAFALTRHLRRLARSATGLGLAAPDEQKVRDGVAAALAEDPDDAEDALFSRVELEKSKEELEQYRRDRRNWQRRLDELDAERERELAAIEARYSRQEPHLFPVAVVFVIPSREAVR